MNDLNPEQLSLLQSILEQARLQLAGAPGELLAGTRDLPVQEVESSPADKATVRLLNDLALEAAEHSQAQLRRVRHALAKFDDGSYGQCEECGNPIGFSRLQARPEARLCIGCQTRAEQRQP
jgi:DnaK suppressor protein